MTSAKSQDEMQAHIAAGEALALFPDGVPGPISLHGQWWIIPVGQEHYQLADNDQAALLTTQAGRLAAGVAAARRAADHGPRRQP